MAASMRLNLAAQLKRTFAEETWKICKKEQSCSNCSRQMEERTGVPGFPAPNPPPPGLLPGKVAGFNQQILDFLLTFYSTKRIKYNILHIPWSYEMLEQVSRQRF